MKISTHLLAAVTGLGLASSASAGFVNGGFEAGNFSGWTVQSGTYSGGVISGLTTTTAHAYIVGTGQPASRDPYSPFDNAFNGNFMAQLNEFVPVNGAGNRNVTRISQTALMLAGETDIYINWAAVMEDPSHALSDEPFFTITINKNGNLFAFENHTANQGLAGGWTAGGSGPDGSPIYYSSNQFHVGGLVAGDSVQVILTVADCGLSGHAAWAYLDGIGTVAAPPPPGVPDGGSTVALLGLALTGLVAVRRKLQLA